MLLWGKKNSYFPYQCFLGPDWPVVVGVYGIIIILNVVVLALIAPLVWPVSVVGTFTCCITLYYYSLTVASDPGIVFRKGEVTPETILTDNTTSQNKEAYQSVASEHVEDAVAMTSTVDLLDHSEELGIATSPPSTANNAPTQVTPVPYTLDFTHPPPPPIPCGTCKLNRPRSARHCRHCNTCIDRLDHHCPWCGKCIGKSNIKSFHIMIGWIIFQSWYLFIVFIVYIVFHVILQMI